ncbi:class I SAM-dependent DNA methyltransferase [Sciscionella sediminilitoris]|uniref:class I SAM-dependent DNA methyltransferase n=1 Tax=Sciscionella sediminilitoris TaxID=1445613 RepID=UPI0004DF96FD|nr:class I SAM-dependent methyltransferase [Sciscionella sp. SE31]
MTEFLARTRDSYDRAAEDYAEWIAPELAAKPLDRALLTAFAELVRDRGPVADIGCGTGRITAFLHDLGLSVSGIDLSPRMLGVARRSHPELRFTEGSMHTLALPDSALGGILAWYSIIHIPDDLLGAVFTEFHRVLAPDGLLQLAFQEGDGTVHLETAGRHRVSLDFHRRTARDVAESLRGCGFRVLAETVREPDREGAFTEQSRQVYLLAGKGI